ncbi:MAG: nucleoside-diphosphate sugar epimerase/dehydratase [Eubacteriales bacterium]
MLCDVLVVLFSSAFALLARFDLSPSSVPPELVRNVLWFAPIDVVGVVVLLWLFHLYSSVWKFAGADELINIMMVGGISFILKLLAMTALKLSMPLGYYFLYTMVMALGCTLVRFFYRFLRVLKSKQRGQGETRVMVIGGGSAGQMLLREFANVPRFGYRVVGIIDDDPAKKAQYINGVKILGGREVIVESAEKYRVDEIIMALPSVAAKQRREILQICKQTKCRLKTVPGLYQLINDEVCVTDLRQVQVEELLGREPVSLDSTLEYITGKTVLVTGGGGSIGSELCRQLARLQPRQLVIVDIYENNAYDIQQELAGKYPALDLVVLIASVRNAKRINHIFETYRPEIVFHAAAHKHVPLMEESPNEAIKNNVFGTYETAMAAARRGVKRFVLISTDKAVNPTNVMGASKRICEMIVQMMDHHYDTEFVAVRFGNVLGSNGSVIPLFKKQIEAGGPVTVTHAEVMRYFMTIPEAVSLILEAGKMARGGEVFVLDMGQPVKILDLAKNMIRLSGKSEDEIEIKITGLRPGEKLFEELLLAEEGMRRTANSKIYIARPIEYDENEFVALLQELKRAAEDDAENIRDYLRRIVLTYKAPDSAPGEVLAEVTAAVTVSAGEKSLLRNN